MSFASCHFTTQKWGAVRSLFTFIAVADVIAAVGFPWVPDMVSAIAGVLGAVVVFTAVDIPGVPAVSAAAPIAGEVFSALLLLVSLTFLACLLLLASVLLLVSLLMLALLWLISLLFNIVTCFHRLLHPCFWHPLMFQLSIVLLTGLLFV